VNGNEVLIGGSPAGTVEEIRLTDDNQAEVTIKVDPVLHEGTAAVIRATSLSGVANHYVSITPGPDNSPELPDDATLAGDATTTPVDLDQLFDTFKGPVRRSLRQFIRGSATIYAGKGPQANRTYKYFAPSLSSTDRLLRELTRDQRAFTDFIVDSSRVVTAVAERSDDLSGLISNSNQALGAIASQNRSLDRSLRLLPPTLRQANTTFVNLRATLDDLDPLVATSKVATRDLDPFLLKLRPVVHRSVPVFRDLRLTVIRPGGSNDLGDTVRALPKVQTKAHNSFNRAIGAVNASQPTIRFARPYAPDLLGAVTKLGQVTAFYDANGHYARVQSAAMNLFEYNTVTEQLDPIPAGNQFDRLQRPQDLLPFTDQSFRRCPGGATQPIAGSNPFLDNGNLTPADCNPAHVPPGP
jgi:phospholipid/cholesterol/gamma-HCH transport system substrate-binding protein